MVVLIKEIIKEQMICVNSNKEELKSKFFKYKQQRKEDNIITFAEFKELIDELSHCRSGICRGKCIVQYKKIQDKQYGKKICSKGLEIKEKNCIHTGNQC